MSVDKRQKPAALPRARPAVESLKPYVPGRSLESFERELDIRGLIKMNQNENPLGPSPKALDAIQKAAASVSLYPDGPAPVLCEALSARWDLPVDWFLAGNGSDEIFRLLTECYLESGDRVVVPEPSFAGYALVAGLMDGEIVRVPLTEGAVDAEGMAKAASDCAAKLVFLCRPNSPTGGVFSEEALRLAMEVFSEQTLVVLDEAYAEFDETPFDSRALANDFPNLILTRTFSKMYGMAGLRLGYGLMRPEIMAPLLKARDPFSVNSLAIAAGIAALHDEEHVERTLKLVWEGKRFLYDLFRRLDLDYLPTQSNFVLFDTNRPAIDVYEDLLRRGVLVRPCGTFGLPKSIRVTVGTAEENQAFARALEKVI